jgi:hypothetical protein
MLGRSVGQRLQRPPLHLTDSWPPSAGCRCRAKLMFEHINPKNGQQAPLISDEIYAIITEVRQAGLRPPRDSNGVWFGRRPEQRRVQAGSAPAAWPTHSQQPRTQHTMHCQLHAPSRPHATRQQTTPLTDTHPLHHSTSPHSTPTSWTLRSSTTGTLTMTTLASRWVRVLGCVLRPCQSQGSLFQEAGHACHRRVP